MNVTNKTVRTYSITDITEDQAIDLLSITKLFPADVFSEREEETIDNLRQALLSANVNLRGQ
jgi:hypothetical protein